MNDISALPIEHQQVLCAAALNYCVTDSDFRAMLAAKTKLKASRIKDISDLLYQKGYFIKYNSYWARQSDYIVSIQYIMPALLFMYSEHQDWKMYVSDKIHLYSTNADIKHHATLFAQSMVMAEKKMKASGISIEYGDWHETPKFSDKEKKELAKIAKDIHVPQRMYWNDTNVENFANLLCPIVNDPVLLPILSRMLDSITNKALYFYLRLNGEKGADTVLSAAKHLHEGFGVAYAELEKGVGFACATKFYANGEWVFSNFALSKNCHHIYLCEAIRTAYQGNITEAISLMQTAIKLNNRNADAQEKGFFFSDYIGTFFLLVVYAKENSEATRKKMEQLLKKKPFTGYYLFTSAMALAKYYKDTNQYIDRTEIRSCISIYKGDKLYQPARQLAYLVARFLGETAESLKLSNEMMDSSRYIPEYAIIRHELSKFIPITDSERQQLTDTFGGKPLLTSIRIKQQWETILEDIMSNEESSTDAAENNAATARGIYVINRYGELRDVREQNRLRSGAWGKGKRLGLSAYLSGSFTMDSIDAAILEKCKSTHSFPSLQYLIPHLTGTSDRLYLDGYSTIEPIEVIEEKPFISIEKDKKGIVIHSNVPKSKIDNFLVYDLDVNNYRLRYFPMNTVEQRYLRQLLSIDTLPYDAEEMLQKVLPMISSKIEIHTDFIEGAQTLLEEKANTVLCLRIVPQNNVYVVNILIVPLAGGKNYFHPGVGDRIIFDERDGNRYQIKRKLSKERDNREALDEVLDDMDVDDNSDSLMLSPEQIVELMDYVHENPDVAYIEWPEGGKMRLSIAQPGSWNITMKSKAGWFDIEGDVNINDETVMSIAELMELVNASRSRFVKLGEDQYLAMSESLRKQIQRLSAVASTSRGKAKVPAIGAALLGEALSGELEIKHPKAIDDLRTKIRRSARLQPAVPDTLNATLRDYQLDGYQWMARLDSWGAGACLADDMGLGKTVQAITFMLDKREDGPLLIVAPASVVPNWRNELRRFAPSLNVVVLNEENDRTAAINEAEEGMVILTTYGLLITQEEAMTEKMWGCICLDEAHTIKNRDTKTSGVCMKMQSKHRLILTGTPLQNHLGELWNLFEFINPGLLGSYEQFQKKFINPIEAGGNEERRQLLRRIIQPFMLRRTKQEVATELPDKEDIKLYVELSEEEMGVYEVIRRRAKDELEQLEQAGKKVNMNTLAEITRLRMASCAAQLAEKKWKGQCSKLDRFVELVADLQQNGHRALVFSQFTSFLEMARKRLDDAKIEYFYLDGSTPMAKREKMVKDFQKGKNNIFLISLKAGGLGLNLTGANYVIHLDPWWNPAIEQQATDRAHRIGQKEKVTVYHLVSANTIEEKILRLHEQKRDLADSLLDGTNQSHKITAKQLLEMLDPTPAHPSREGE